MPRDVRPTRRVIRRGTEREGQGGLGTAQRPPLQQLHIMTGTSPGRNADGRNTIQILTWSPPLP